MAASERVLRVPQSEGNGSVVLLHLKSAGSSPLDLKVVGTEGEAPYVIKLKQDKIASTKASGTTTSDQEWADILTAFFSQQPLEDIHATATVQSESSVVITIRKQVQGISQRLGAITLKYDPDEAIELFEWCASAAMEVSETKLAASVTEKKLSELQDSVTALKQQLEDMLVAKANDETAILQKFRDLLNEKKAKIRDQNTIITRGTLATTTARVASPLEQSPEPPTKKPAKPRSATRKVTARGKRVAPQEESDEDETIPPPSSVDVKMEPDDSDNDGNTTERTASVASETEDEDGDEQMRNGTTGPQVTETAAAETATAGEPAKKVSQAPPPKRELPFANKKASRSAAAATNEETDSDDEL